RRSRTWTMTSFDDLVEKCKDNLHSSLSIAHSVRPAWPALLAYYCQLHTTRSETTHLKQSERSELSWPIYTRNSHEYCAVAKYEDDDKRGEPRRRFRYWYKDDPNRMFVGKGREDVEKK
ncbi:hypothetical protein PFISCL1PPCAC_21242, partial [Pristionchus fissidentatus]